MSNTMLLFPTRSEHHSVYIRYADEHAGLKAVSVNTLVVFDAGECDKEGVDLAIERTRAQRDPKILFI